VVVVKLSAAVAVVAVVLLEEMHQMTQQQVLEGLEF
jgi:hypothetical protein